MFNYEIGIRGKQHIDTVSRKMVLNRCSDLLNKADTSKYKKYRKEVLDIKMNWSKKMTQLQEKGYTDKEMLNIKKDSVKLKNLESLKSQDIPGPFTSKDQVESFMKQDINNNDKNVRLYNEVRYARLTSLSLNESASVFRLKINGKNLETKDYASNLIQYFDDSRKVSSLTLLDLNNVLCGLQDIIVEHPKSNNTQEDNHNQIRVGEHIAVFWVQDVNKYVWYLGVVDQIEKEEYLVSHLVRTDKEGCNWAFPEEADLHKIRLLIRI